MFIASLSSLVNDSSIVNNSSHTKYVSLSNQKYEIQPTLINLHLHHNGFGTLFGILLFVVPKMVNI